MHIDEDQIQRLLHGELEPVKAAGWRAHLATCDECETELTRAQREEAEIVALLGSLDHAPPQVDVRALLSAPRSSTIERGESMKGTQRPGWGRWAAGLALTLGLAGAAFAAPGSPLPRWLRDLFQGRAAAPARVPADTQGTPRLSDAAGLSIAPGARLSIVFLSYQNAGSVTVSFTERTDVAVRALQGGATISSDSERLTIDNAGGSARFEIEIPVSASWLEIRVADRRILLKEGARIHADVPEQNRQYTLPLSRPPQ